MYKYKSKRTVQRTWALAPPIFKANKIFSPLKPTQNLFQPPNLHKAPVSPFNILLTRHYVRLVQSQCY